MGQTWLPLFIQFVGALIPEHLLSWEFRQTLLVPRCSGFSRILTARDNKRSFDHSGLYNEMSLAISVEPFVGWAARGCLTPWPPTLQQPRKSLLGTPRPRALGARKAPKVGADAETLGDAWALLAQHWLDFQFQGSRPPSVTAWEWEPKRGSEMRGLLWLLDTWKDSLCQIQVKSVDPNSDRIWVQKQEDGWRRSAYKHAQSDDESIQGYEVPNSNYAKRNKNMFNDLTHQPFESSRRQPRCQAEITWYNDIYQKEFLHWTKWLVED